MALSGILADGDIQSRHNPVARGTHFCQLKISLGKRKARTGAGELRFKRLGVADGLPGLLCLFLGFKERDLRLALRGACLIYLLSRNIAIDAERLEPSPSRCGKGKLCLGAADTGFGGASLGPLGCHLIGLDCEFRLEFVNLRNSLLYTKPIRFGIHHKQNVAAMDGAVVANV